ncbi:response regulator, partial [Streptomyces bambusae]|uniref:response regulator n=1 Tax=Streptomyces bambusae TaxID=1550616 RepID=UPI002155481A
STTRKISVRVKCVKETAPDQFFSQIQGYGEGSALFRRRRKALGEPGPQVAVPGQPSPDADWLLEEHPPSPPRTYEFHGEKVLIVDDDVRNVFALTSVLEQHGLAVLYAENGREGIDVLEQHDDVAVGLMDIMMPEMDGYATTAAIRRMPQFEGLPIIALTAKAMKGDKEKALDSGASDYVTKPVDPDYLLSVMEQHMRRR